MKLFLLNALALCLLCGGCGDCDGYINGQMSGKARGFYLVITDTTMLIDRVECLNADKSITNINKRFVIVGDKVTGTTLWHVVYTNGTSDTIEMESPIGDFQTVDGGCDDVILKIASPKLISSTFSETRIGVNVSSRYGSYNLDYDTLYAKP